MKLHLQRYAPLLIALIAFSAPLLKSQDAKTDRVVEVKVNYTGTGTVDEKHKIYIAMWDTGDFMSGGAMPVEIQPVSAKNGKATFAHVATSPVYFSIVYDPTGNWDAQSMPPSGSVFGIYSKEAGKAEPVKSEPGKPASVEIAFDDSMKMP